MNILSEYHGDKSIRQALVYKENGKYWVRQINEGNVVYTASFNYQESAEDFAEDWVRGETNE